jgi:hypothetical protein
VTAQPLNTLTYDSPTRVGIFVEQGDYWVRYMVHDPRPVQREGTRIVSASILAFIGVILLLPAYWFGIFSLIAFGPYIGVSWFFFGLQIWKIRTRRKHGCPPTMIEASPAGLRLAYFHETQRDVTMPAQNVRAMCVRKMRRAGGDAWFWGLDFVVEGWDYYRLVFVATEADVPHDMVWHLTWKLGFSQMLPEPPISTQMRALNTAE